jgi:hypothetical protein
MGPRHRGIVAIDPGKRSGWAVFVDAALALAGAWPEADMLDDALPMVGIAPAVAVIELPVIYPLGLGKGDPNDLITLALLVGDLRGYYRRAGLDVALVKPRTWKGTVPKPIHNERVLGALTPDERALLPRYGRKRGFDHNMLDAVGLGLWQLAKERQRS